MGLQLNDRSVLTEAFTVYPAQNDWWLPLGELTEYLGISIQVAASENMASGFILTEKRKFNLDGRACTIQYDNKIEKFDCNAMTVHVDEIYILASYFQKWFPVKLNIDPLKSNVELTPTEKLPLQLKRERDKLLEKAQSHSPDYDPGYSNENNEYSVLDKFALDERLTFSRAQQEKTSIYQLTHNTQIGGEFAGLETFGFLSGDSETIRSWRLQLGRKDPNGNLLGPMGATQLQMIDVDLPGLPLISKGITGKGFFISNIPLQKPTNFETQDFQGPLLVGWEVLLYRNDVLIERQTVAHQGRYFFKSIPLLYGLNQFKLVFFGPHGETNTEYRNIDISEGLIKAGQSQYFFGAAQVRAEDNDKELRQRTSFQYTQGLSQHLSLSTGFMHDKGTTDTYGFLGVSGVNDLFLFSTHCAFSTLGGKACEWREQMAIWGMNLGAKYSKYFNGFKSRSVNRKGPLEDSQIDANLAFVIPTTPSISMTWEISKMSYIDLPSTATIRNRTTFNLGPVNLNNELNYTFNNTAPMEGRLDLNFSPWLFRFRTGIGYLVKILKQWETEIAFSPASSYSIVANYNYLFETHSTEYGLSLTKSFKEFSVSVDTLFKNFKDFNIGLNFVFSFIPDSQQASFHFSKDSLVSQGAASVRVFLDNNRNGIWDTGDVPIPKIALNVNQSEEQHKTDLNGFVFIHSLKPYQPSDISISYRSLNNPFWKSTKKGIRFYPRPSKVFNADLPIEIVGAVDGTVSEGQDANLRAKRAVKVELINMSKVVIANTKSDKMGFYVFEDVAPGKYWVRVSREQREKKKWIATPKVRVVEILKEGSFESSQDFTLTQ